MFRNLLANLAVFSTSVMATVDYSEWDAAINPWGYGYTAHEITTSDGYILTTFRITEDAEGNALTPSMPPVVIMHGNSMDASTWLASQANNSDGVKPFQLMLADAGYDVYCASNRGTVMSRQHTTLDVASQEYWDFSWLEMGLYDVRANIEFAVSQSSFEKAFYIGYSQGTVQMFYSLAMLESEFHAANTYKVLAMAPCFETSNALTYDLYAVAWGALASMGVYAVNGPNETADQTTVCDAQGAACSWYTNLST